MKKHDPSSPAVLRNMFICQQCMSCENKGSCLIFSAEVAPFIKKVRCLGAYCDAPCERQTKNTDLTIELLIKMLQRCMQELARLHMHNLAKAVGDVLSLQFKNN